MWRSWRHKCTYIMVSDEERMGMIDPSSTYVKPRITVGSISPASVKASPLAYHNGSVLIVECSHDFKKHFAGKDERIMHGLQVGDNSVLRTTEKSTLDVISVADIEC